MHVSIIVIVMTFLFHLVPLCIVSTLLPPPITPAGPVETLSIESVVDYSSSKIFFGSGANDPLGVISSKLGIDGGQDLLELLTSLLDKSDRFCESDSSTTSA